MPELPEVETLARGLRKYIVGQKIVRLAVRDRKRFRGTPNQLKRFVLGHRIGRIHRWAKWLGLELDSGYTFVIHLKMTGQLLYDNGQPKFLGGHSMGSQPISLPNSHTRVIFYFQDQSRLFFQDMRRFGLVQLYSPDELAKYFQKKHLALEPIQRKYTLPYFMAQLQRHSAATVKSTLLDQATVAGIGNIYADDICWAARVKPTRRVRTLSRTELKALFQASRKILREAINLGGTSFSHYLHIDGRTGSYWAKRKVYGRTGENCSRCGTIIKKTRCAGRGTHYCPHCQR